MIPSRHSRAEARFPRQHSGEAPEPSSVMRPLWHDLAAGCLLAAFLFILVWGL